MRDDDEVRVILRRFETDETTVHEDHVLEYLRTHTKGVHPNEVVSQWWGDLVEYGFDQLSDEPLDPTDYPDSWTRATHGDGRKDGRPHPLDDVMDDLRRELVLRVAKAARDEYRDIYDALENE